MDVIVLAGGIPGPDDPLYTYTQGQPKALVNLAGKPMAQWVLDAFSKASSADHVLVVGLEPDCGLVCDKPMAFLSDQGQLLQNVKAGLQHNLKRNPHASHVLVASCDIPAITPEIVDWRVQDGLEHRADLDYTVVDRPTMEARFPGANRSFVKLRDYELCGGDLNIVRPSVTEKEELWKRLIAARKNAVRQAALVGFDILFLLLLGRLELKDAERRVSKRLGLNGRASISPYAELAMDVDKPHQLQLVEQFLTSKSPASL